MKLQVSKSVTAKALVGGLAALALSGSANAALTVYSGFDPGASAIGALSGAAAGAFDVAVGAHNTITFENAVPAGVAISRGSITNTFGCAPALCGFNTTSGGAFALSVFGGLVTFTFTAPISSFGAYFTGVQITANNMSFNDGAAHTIAIPGTLATGGISFVGFTDFGKSISSITIDMNNDVVAVDDIRYLAAAVPEPETYALMLAGLAAMGTVARRRKSV